MNRIRRVLGRRSLHSRRSRLLAASSLAALPCSPSPRARPPTSSRPSRGGSPNADEIDTLYKFVLAVAIVVFVGVEGALLYSLVKFQARKGAVAAQIRGNTRLEIGWTIGAALILVVLAVVTFAMLGDIRNPPNSDANGAAARRRPDACGAPDGKSLNIYVNGQQYVWRFTYPQDCKNAPLDAPFSYEEMVVPVDTTVTLDINAQDVAHSWWIPKLGGKFDAIPGYTNHTWFKIPGKLAGQTFPGQCAELCGRNHANMTARVRAVTPVAVRAVRPDAQDRAEGRRRRRGRARKQLQAQPGTP